MSDKPSSKGLDSSLSTDEETTAQAFTRSLQSPKRILPGEHREGKQQAFTRSLQSPKTGILPCEHREEKQQAFTRSLQSPKRILPGEHREEKQQDTAEESQPKKSKLRREGSGHTKPQDASVEPKNILGETSVSAEQSGSSEVQSSAPSIRVRFKPPGDLKSSSKSLSAQQTSPSWFSRSTRPAQETGVEALFVGDEDGDTPLHIAIVHKHPLVPRVIDHMVLYGSLNIPNRLKQTPLHLAVLTCQPNIVEHLAARGADVNIADRNGQTALHLACKNADVEDVKALRKGASKSRNNSLSLERRNFGGLAPIHLATVTGSCEVLGELLDMGADINVKDSTSGRTALHHSVEAHNLYVTRFLLTHKADVNAQTFSGNTPLHAASGRRMESVVKLLLEHGAEVLIRNVEGDTALPETHSLFLWAQRPKKKAKEKEPS